MNAGFFLKWAASIDEDVETLITRILDKKLYPEQAYRTCMGVLALDKKVGHERFVRVCALALDNGQRQHLIILDDFGLQPIDVTSSHILLEVVEDRYNVGSLMITSQVPVDNWYDLIPDNTVADVMGHFVRNLHLHHLK